MAGKVTRITQKEFERQVYSAWKERRTADLKERVCYLLQGKGKGQLSQKTAEDFAGFIIPSRLEAVVSGKPAFPLGFLVVVCNHYGPETAAEYVNRCNPGKFYQERNQEKILGQAINAVRSRHPDLYDQLPDEMKRTVI